MRRKKIDVGSISLLKKMSVLRTQLRHMSTFFDEVKTANAIHSAGVEKERQNTVNKNEIDRLHCTQEFLTAMNTMDLSGSIMNAAKKG